MNKIEDSTKKTKSSKEDKSTRRVISEFKEFHEEFKNESDRAAVVLGAAKLDLILYQILSRHMLPCPNSTDSMFEGNGPLSTFSSKIDMTYRLGIIDANFCKSLHLIRKIRNDFAHEVSGSSLDSGSHRDRIKALAAPLKKVDRFEKFQEAFFDEHDGCRADFFTALGVMVIRLDALSENITTVDASKAYEVI